jgi:hypothetical protein
MARNNFRLARNTTSDSVRPPVSKQTLATREDLFAESAFRDNGPSAPLRSTTQDNRINAGWTRCDYARAAYSR